MTAINLATDIPSQITTLEQLHFWASLALAAINPTLVVTEGVGYDERACQAGIFFVGVTGKHRGLTRGSVEVAPDYLSGAQKTWMYAIEYSNSPIPSNFKAN